ncbi:membrane protein [Azospirillum thiophilum]|uniref:MFS transporter n=1 Tax=Azospirillum thiophilum TaxID=528244 RepID=A0AAC8W2J4_9PROT|nr:MFS transporter [Azospirillum thiophilum]ALG73918.1 hypothetical protein AL072_23005 [Azospirillum thiophilum]KJR63736.1 membrane protein [Azospirillum thiophilum]
MTGPATAIPGTRPFFGPTVVAATFVMAAFGWGVGFYGPSIYLHAVVARTGWPVTLVSTAVTVHFLFGALVIATLPRMYRSFGVPRVTMLGALLLACGVAGWAGAATPGQLFAAALASGAGWVTMGAAAVNAIVSPWFVRTRPSALGMAYNGASIGGVVFSPLWTVLISTVGFLTAAVAVGGVMVAVVSLLALLVFARTPEGLGQRPDGAGADPSHAPAGPPGPADVRPLPGGSLWRSRRFVTLAAAMALGLFAQIGLLAHLFSLLAPAVGEAAAGLAMGGATAAAVAGRSVAGRMIGPATDRRLVACASYAVQAVGSLVLLSADGGPWAWVTGILVFGFGIGNATSLPPLIAQAEFVREDVARAVPMAVAVGQATYAFAPALFGLLRHDPGPAPETGASLFLLAAVVQGCAVACLAWGRRRPNA